MLAEIGVCVLASLPAIVWLCWKRSWLLAVVVATIGLGLAPLAWLLVKAGLRPSEWTPFELVVVAIGMTLLALGIGALLVLFASANSTSTKSE